MLNATTESVAFPFNPATTSGDVLDQLLRQGAQQLLIQAVEAEIAWWLAQRSHLTDEQGHRLVVRNGHAAPRTVVTGVGPIEVKIPRACHQSLQNGSHALLVKPGGG